MKGWDSKDPFLSRTSEWNRSHQEHEREEGQERKRQPFFAQDAYPDEEPYDPYNKRDRFSNPNQQRENLKDLSFWGRKKSGKDFEEEYIEDEEGEWEDRRAPVKFIVTLAILVMGIGLAWFSYQWFNQIGSSTPVVIEPNDPIYKQKPENPGGMQVPHQDKLVYERFSPQQGQHKVERLIPQNEQVLVPPQTPVTVDSREQNSQNVYDPQAQGNTQQSYQSLDRSVYGPQNQSSYPQGGYPTQGSQEEQGGREGVDLEYPEEDDVHSSQPGIQNYNPVQNGQSGYSGQNGTVYGGPYPQEHRASQQINPEHARYSQRAGGPAEQRYVQNPGQVIQESQQRDEGRRDLPQSIPVKSSAKIAHTLEDDPQLQAVLASEEKKPKEDVLVKKKGYRLRLATLKDEKVAEEEKERLSKITNTLPKGVNFYIQKTSSLERGVLYSVMLGYFKDKPDAQSYCQYFPAKTGCIVLGP